LKSLVSIKIQISSILLSAKLTHNNVCSASYMINLKFPMSVRTGNILRYKF